MALVVPTSPRIHSFKKRCGNSKVTSLWFRPQGANLNLRLPRFLKRSYMYSEHTIMMEAPGMLLSSNTQYDIDNIQVVFISIGVAVVGSTSKCRPTTPVLDLDLFIYFSSAGCFSDRWIKWLAWFVVSWYQVHHKWQRRRRNLRRIPEGRLSCSFSYLILTNQPTTSAAQRRSVQDCNVLSLGCRRNQPCTSRRTPECTRG